MKLDGILQLYKRIIKKYGIWYKQFIGDGDGSAYSNVDMKKSYGASYFVKTE